jgi:hypothetical protein
MVTNPLPASCEVFLARIASLIVELQKARGGFDLDAVTRYTSVTGDAYELNCLVAKLHAIRDASGP